ncbi:hypothetical protein NJ76_24275 [Rhodococcus sp. IITR03]|nr:hypothetical protein NJ76_24275 [Rhodococcus sp. IITR03]
MEPTSRRLRCVPMLTAAGIYPQMSLRAFGGQALRAAVQRTVVGGSTAISSTARTWCRLSPTSESYRNRSPGSVTS